MLFVLDLLSNTRCQSRMLVATSHAYCSLVLEAQPSITVHYALGEVEVPVLVLALDATEPGPQDGLVVALDVEADIFGSLQEV